MPLFPDRPLPPESKTLLESSERTVVAKPTEPMERLETTAIDLDRCMELIFEEPEDTLRSVDDIPPGHDD